MFDLAKYLITRIKMLVKCKNIWLYEYVHAGECIYAFTSGLLHLLNNCSIFTILSLQKWVYFKFLLNKKHAEIHPVLTTGEHAHRLPWLQYKNTINHNSELGFFSKSEPFSNVNKNKLVPFKLVSLEHFFFITICLFSKRAFSFLFPIWLQVLIESQQMRKEADNSGPLTELEHWKCMSAKFNSIIEQIKGSDCRTVINILNIGHSNLLKVIFFFFSRQTLQYLFLYIFERFFSEEN